MLTKVNFIPVVVRGLQAASHVAASFVGVGGGAGVTAPGLRTRLRLSELNLFSQCLFMKLGEDFVYVPAAI